MFSDENDRREWLTMSKRCMLLLETFCPGLRSIPKHLRGGTTAYVHIITHHINQFHVTRREKNWK